MRTVGAKNKDTFEFQKKFDALAQQHGDPLVLMFQISGASPGYKRGWTKNHRLEASKQLLSYRYPKLKAIEAKLEAMDTQMEISWMEQSLVDANAGTDTLQAEAITISVTPE